jgi:hypothetical protein
MNIKSILKGAAGVALDVFAPGSRQLINVLLPTGKQLPAGATGEQAQSVIDTLPPDQKQSILEKELDLKIAQEEGWTSRYQAMCQADGQSTRPRIALMMGQVMCFEICAFTVWCFVYPEQMASPALWTVFATLTGVPAGLLGKYFGELRREQRNRQETLGAPPAAGLLTGLLKTLR